MIPIVIALLIKIIRGRDLLDNAIFKNRFGTLLDGLSEKGFFGIYWNIVIMLRWTLTVVIIVALRDYYAIQIILLMMISLAVQMVLLHYKPFDGAVDNVLSLCNEILIMIYLYLLIGITDINVDYELRNLIGWCLLGVVLFSFAANFLKMIALFGIKYFRLLQ